MAKYIMKCKEVGRTNVLTSSLDCEKKSREELISFWGLDQDDIDSFQLFEVIDGKEVEI